MTKLRDDPEMPDNMRDAAREQDAEALDDESVDAYCEIVYINGVMSCSMCTMPVEECTCFGDDV